VGMSLTCILRKDSCHPLLVLCELASVTTGERRKRKTTRLSDEYKKGELKQIAIHIVWLISKLVNVY